MAHAACGYLHRPFITVIIFAISIVIIFVVLILFEVITATRGLSWLVLVPIESMLAA